MKKVILAVFLFFALSRCNAQIAFSPLVFDVIAETQGTSVAAYKHRYAHIYLYIPHTCNALRSTFVTEKQNGRQTISTFAGIDALMLILDDSSEVAKAVISVADGAGRIEVINVVDVETFVCPKI
jgi:hypothetical protein